MSDYLRLGVNIDHVATVRNARGSDHPDPVDAAILAEEAGADGITAHLREDRRHIRDRDIARLKDTLKVPLNLEMAATEEMQQIALKHKPHAICLVPERRQERTTEAGLDVFAQKAHLGEYIKPLQNAGCRISLFVGTDIKQIRAAAEAGGQVVEIHTGPYCEAKNDSLDQAISRQLDKIKTAAQVAHELGLEVHAGHGLTFQSVREIASIGIIRELNIGHFLIGEAIFSGLREAVQAMRRTMDEARNGQ
ncbi:MAG: pyridoxine 5'-phosphate synthase [Rhodobacteraceae bacterium]|nr:pyridoxine 5'-phosphate synthase [Paracoccaceae bacterium]MCY4306920.1 pyridoxine 5'-phosphate synthase [Paracoccaceae bacterium]